MKKLMFAAAVAAIGVVGSAAEVTTVTTTTLVSPYAQGLNVSGQTPCINCGYSSSGREGDCGTVVFKVTGSGKAALDKGSYKTVGAIKIKKGALAIVGDKCLSGGYCCYERGVFFAKIKAGKKTFDLMAPINLKVWSIFGKNLEKARDWETRIKPGKSVCLDSALFVTTVWQSDCANPDYLDKSPFFLDWDGDVELVAANSDWNTVRPFDGDFTALAEDNLPQFAFWASAFGKVDWKVSGLKESKKYCKNTSSGCTPIITPKSYSGWFVGTYLCCNAENCFMCDCPDLDVFGGTWKAVYQKKVSTLSGAMNLAGVKFYIPKFLGTYDDAGRGEWESIEDILDVDED